MRRAGGGGAEQGIVRRHALALGRMDRAGRLAQWRCRAPGAQGDDLGEDRDRRLRRCARAHIEPAWGVDPGDRGILQSGLQQPLDPPLLGAAAAERAHIPGAARQRRDQRRLVELGVVGEDEDDVAGGERAALHVAVRPVDDHLCVRREPRAANERLARVADRHLVADPVGQARHLGREIDCAEDHHPRPGRERLDVHGQFRAHHLAAGPIAADAGDPLVELAARIALDRAIEQLGHAEGSEYAF